MAPLALQEITLAIWLLRAIARRAEGTELAGTQSSRGTIVQQAEQQRCHPL